MIQTLNILKAFMLGAVGVCMLAAALFFFQAASTVHRLETNSTGILGELSATLEHLNRPCGSRNAYGEEPCGTLAQAGKVLANTHDLIIQSQIVERKEAALLDGVLPVLIRKANITLDNVNTATADLHPLLLEATARVKAVEPIEANLAAVTGNIATGSKTMFASLDQATANVNALIANPNFPVIIEHVAGISASADAMLFTANRVETKATYNYLNPSHNPVKRTWQALSPFLLPGAQIVAATVR